MMGLCMINWKWALGLLGAGGVGVIAKREMDRREKIPRVGDRATVRTNAVSLQAARLGLASGGFLPATVVLTLTAVRPNGMADGVFDTQIDSIGETFTFPVSSIVGITRNGKALPL